MLTGKCINFTSSIYYIFVQGMSAWYLIYRDLLWHWKLFVGIQTQVWFWLFCHFRDFKMLGRRGCHPGFLKKWKKKNAESWCPVNNKHSFPDHPKFFIDSWSPNIKCKFTTPTKMKAKSVVQKKVLPPLYTVFSKIPPWIVVHCQPLLSFRTRHSKSFQNWCKLFQWVIDLNSIFLNRTCWKIYIFP